MNTSHDAWLEWYEQRWSEVRRELVACWRYQLGVARACDWCGLGEKDIADAGCGRARPR